MHGSKNRGGPPKSSIFLIGFSSINHPFWGGNTHIFTIQTPFWLPVCRRSWPAPSPRNSPRFVTKICQTCATSPTWGFGGVAFVCLLACMLACFVVCFSSVGSCICKWFDFNFSDLRKPRLNIHYDNFKPISTHTPKHASTMDSKQQTGWTVGLGLNASQHFGVWFHIWVFPKIGVPLNHPF